MHFTAPAELQQTLPSQWISTAGCASPRLSSGAQFLPDPQHWQLHQPCTAHLWHPPQSQSRKSPAKHVSKHPKGLLEPLRPALSTAQDTRQAVRAWGNLTAPPQGADGTERSRSCPCMLPSTGHRAGDGGASCSTLL